MTAAGPWSVKGIDPKAREIAKDLARRSGMTLGEWLNQMIIEGGEPEPPPFDAPPTPPYADPRRRALDEMYREARAARAAAPPPRPIEARYPDIRFPEARPLETRHLESRFAEPHAADAGEVARVARTLGDLSLRMEAAEHRSTLAISGIDQSVMGMLSRLDDIERDQGADATRSESSVAEVRAAQAQVAERLRRLEHEDSTRVEALKALEAALNRVAGQMQHGEAANAQSRAQLDALAKRVEQVETGAGQFAEATEQFADAGMVETVLSRMADRLEEAETRTSAAVQSLQSSFAGLDARLRSNEARYATLSGAEIERRFQGLAEDLSKKVDAARNELAERLRAAADTGRLDRLDAALREIRGQVDQAEQHSAQAIDRIGREVMRVAKGLGERIAVSDQQGQARAAQGEARAAQAESRAAQTDARIAAVETRSAAAVETLGGEVARIADVMETRVRQADGAQAQALEKLGGEIARIAERLTDRISSSDRRSAEAIDEVSDKVAKISERMDERQERGVSELADRIRQSEERTAKLLEEARERLDQRLSARAAVAAPEAPPMPTAAPSAPQIMPAPMAMEPEAPPAPHLPNNTDPFGSASLSSAPLSSFGRAPEPAAAPALAVEPPPAPATSPTGPAPVDFAADDFALDNDPFADRAAFASELSPFDPHEDFAPSSTSLAAAPIAAPEATLATPVRASLSSGLAASLAAEPAPQFPAPQFGVRELAAPSFAAAEPDLPPPAGFQAPAAPTPEAQASSAFMGFSVSDFAPAPEEPSGGQMSTREMLEAAREAARRASGGRGGDPAPSGSIPAPEAARAPRPFGLTLPGRRKKENAPTLRALALVTLTAGAVSAAALATHKLNSNVDVAADPAESAAHGDLVAAAAPSAAPTPGAAVQSPNATPTLALALTPLSVPDPASGKPPAKTAKGKKADKTETADAAPAPAKSAHAVYADAVNRIESGDLGAVADLKKAADMGEVGAQFYLARLYEEGGSGLNKDLSAARHWTQKAAEGGDALAMYNYASYTYAGDGGSKDLPTAVTWFRRAAERGVVNGQYNLAQLYEKGYGVPQDTAEAYKWYLAAASTGDAGAKAAAAALKGKLAPDAQARAEKAAVSLHAQAGDMTKTAQAALRP